MSYGRLLSFAVFAALSGALSAETIRLTPAADPASDRRDEVNRLISAAKPGDELLFAKGEYYFSNTIVVAGRKVFALRAEPGTVFRFRFLANGYVTGAVEDFIVAQSEDVRLEGFTCTTDRPVSVSGRVVAVHPETNEYDVRLEGDSHLDGTEPLCIADTCDEHGTPDRAHSWHNMNSVEEDDGKGGKRTRNRGIPYRLIEKDLVRVSAPKKYDFAQLDVGHRIVYRLVIGGGVMDIRDSRRVLVKDVTIWRSPSISVVIEPCSADVTFDGLRIYPEPGSKSLYSSNADGIHVAGMSGTLTLRNCLFDGFGDDPLNVHGKASELHAYDPATGAATCVWRLFHKEPRLMGDKWALKGDELAVYERTTFREKGRVRVGEVRGKGKFVLETPQGFALQLGDILINTRDYPKVRVSNCTARNVRSRGLLLQSRDVKVTDCTFTGIGGAAILAAPDINNWYESGPTAGLEVRNCTFERCGARSSAIGAFTVKVNHEGPIDAFPSGVHRDITLADCTFRACGNSPTNVCIASTTGVRVENCRFEQTKGTGDPVVFVNCTDVHFDAQE